jgi:hypothetical protein
MPFGGKSVLVDDNGKPEEVREKTGTIRRCRTHAVIGNRLADSAEGLAKSFIDLLQIDANRVFNQQAAGPMPGF